MQNISCDLCGSSNYEVLWERGRFGMDVSTVICKDCGLVYTNPRMDEVETKTFYKEIYPKLYRGSERPTSEIVEQRRKTALEQYGFLANNFDNNFYGDVLEIGASTGVFLANFSKAKWNAIGIELNSKYAAYAAEEFGLEVRVGNFEDVQLPPAAFDLVCLLRVLEHFRSPAKALYRINELLKRNGIIYVEVPDVTHPYGGNLDFFFQNAHFYNFSPKTLRAYLKINGFTVMKESHRGDFLRVLAKKVANRNRNIDWNIYGDNWVDVKQHVLNQHQIWVHNQVDIDRALRVFDLGSAVKLLTKASKSEREPAHKLFLLEKLTKSLLAQGKANEVIRFLTNNYFLDPAFSTILCRAYTLVNNLFLARNYLNKNGKSYWERQLRRTNLRQIMPVIQPHITNIYSDGLFPTSIKINLRCSYCGNKFSITRPLDTLKDINLICFECLEHYFIPQSLIERVWTKRDQDIFTVTRKPSSRKKILAMTYVNRHFEKIVPVLKRLIKEPLLDLEILLFTPQEWQSAERHNVPFLRFESFSGGKNRQKLFDWQFGLKALVIAINQIRPDMLLMMEVNYIARDAVRYAKSLGIQTFIMQHGTPNKFSLHAFEPFEADVMATWGKFTNDYLIENGVEKEKLIITGGPAFDHLSSISPDKERIAQQLGLNPEKEWILFATQATGAGGRPTAEEIEKSIKKVCKVASKYENYELIFQVHPMQRIDDIQQYVTGRAHVCKYSSTSELIAVSKLFVTMFSTTALDALYMGKNILLINLAADMEFFPLARMGAALEARSEEDIEKHLLTILNKCPSFDQSAAQAYMLSAIDGKATGRVCKEIMKRLDLKKKKEPFIHQKKVTLYKRDTAKVIYHVGAWSGNFGDKVLQRSIIENLQKISPYRLEFRPIHAQQTDITDQLVEEINSEGNLLLIGGGGLIFHRSEDKSLSGWQFSSTIEEIEKIEAPIVVYAIGYNQFAFDNFRFSEYTAHHLQKMLSKSALFSVRNTGSKKELELLNVRGDIEVTPDPGMFLKSRNVIIPEFDQDRIRIGINWVSDRPELTFPSPWRANKERAMANLVKACAFISERYNAQIVYISHMPAFDQEIINRLRGSNIKHLLILEDVLPSLYPPSLAKAPEFVDIYRQMNFVIGMRGHANIIPFGQGTPIIGFASHRKVRYFLEDSCLSEYLVDLRFPETSSTDHIIHKVNSFFTHRKDYLWIAEKSLNQAQKAKDAFNQKIINLL